MSKMNQIDRILFIIELLKDNSLTIHDLKRNIEKRYSKISLRQIQRDLEDIIKFLSKDESINTYRVNYLKYYKIEKYKQEELLKNDNVIIETKFYYQNFTQNNFEKFELIKNAINESKSILISNLINDETGDNTNFITKNISFIPIKIINHRNTFYVGGLNIKKSIIQIFGINQLEKISISKSFKNQIELNNKFNDELSHRFGVSKNIDAKVYDIKIEISSVLAGFVKNHFWHHSQKFTKCNNNLILNFKCGINRELLGWLFQWMYNIRIIEPQILKDLYDITINEIQNNSTKRHPLVYKNIFVPE